jgi:hypothetical protein
VNALPIIKPIKILAGAEKIFGLCIGSFSNLIANEVVKIAPKSQGSGKCKNINNTEPQKPIKIANNIFDRSKSFIINIIGFLNI